MHNHVCSKNTFLTTKKMKILKLLNKEIIVPKYLREVHGFKASIFDLIVTYLSALIAIGVVLISIQNLSLTTIQVFILCLIAFDLSGGVVANFTRGTNDYYAGDRPGRIWFMIMDSLQPFLLFWIFSQDVLIIVVVSVYTFLSMILVNNIRIYDRQRATSSFLIVIGILGCIILPAKEPLLRLMLIFYVIKLVLSFPVRWTNCINNMIEKKENEIII